jgi:hypothetical protein
VNRRIDLKIIIEIFFFVNRLLYRDAQENKDRDMDLLEVLTLLAKNSNGW